ncbi:PaaI family thioesterase [Amycolatopsis rubida]|uniref:Acyl-coenzyme A thioesterase THEM4 n=1 Tax=Amycolatopsis rubida TaxID=112413 RepID=A0A1I5SCJ7_9PSEU|nr:PaaI family thioesterase [Amycolatopsis rubida]SFP68451.1 Acyl-coenzyme A thioesterase PaaI, contains HGG motif [Amycolatopsis rubida]
MTVHRLTGTTHRETHCFVCSPTNESGLRIPFDYDDVAKVVHARFSFGENQSGAPTFVHGGIALAVLNEAMAWAVVSETGDFAVAASMTTDFRRPLRIGSGYSVRGTVLSRDAGQVRAEATIADDSARACAHAEAWFRVLSAATAQRLKARVARP